MLRTNVCSGECPFGSSHKSVLIWISVFSASRDSIVLHLQDIRVESLSASTISCGLAPKNRDAMGKQLVWKVESRKINFKYTFCNLRLLRIGTKGTKEVIFILKPALLLKSYRLTQKWASWSHWFWQKWVLMSWKINISHTFYRSLPLRIPKYGSKLMMSMSIDFL